MIEYWHWHTTHFGTETYWIGILPHDQQPGRVYAELSRLGAEFRTAGDRVVGLEPDAQVGLLYSARSKWGLAFQPPSRSPAHPSSPRGTTSTSGRTTGSSRPSTAAPSTPGSPPASSTTVIVGPDGLGLDPAGLAAELPVLIVPGLLVAGDELLAWLWAYAAAGGHLVIGPRTAYGDDEGRARTEVKPAHLADAAGVRYQEFSNLLQPVPVTLESDGFSLSAGAARSTGATAW